MLKSIGKFLHLGTLATVASVVGIGAGLNSMFNSGGGGSGGGGGGSGVPGAMTYVPQWQGGADQLWQQIMQQMGGDANTERSTLLPFLQSAFGDASSRAPGIEQLMRVFAGDFAGEGGNLISAGNQLRGAGSQVWQTALDPQNALHDRTQQQLTDQVRGADSARGIAMGDISAGHEGTTLSNFDIDWQNNQLGRQLAGLQGMGGAYDAAGRETQAGTAELTGSAALMQGADMYPYQLGGAYTGAFNGMYSPFQALSGNLGQYMGLGQSGGQQAFNQGQVGLNNLTTGLQQFSQLPWLQNFFNSPAGYPANGATGDYGVSNPGDNWAGPG